MFKLTIARQHIIWTIALVWCIQYATTDDGASNSTFWKVSSCFDQGLFNLRLLDMILSNISLLFPFVSYLRCNIHWSRKIANMICIFISQTSKFLLIYIKYLLQQELDLSKVQYKLNNTETYPPASMIARTTCSPKPLALNNRVI